MQLRKDFHEQLDTIHRDVVRLAALVTESIPRGTEALLDRDLQASQVLVDRDDVIDALAIDIEERCFSVLALQSPMASELRGIVAAMKLVGEIERSGDLVVNISKAVRRIYPLELPPEVRGLIEQMDEQAQKLFRLAMDAYADRDAALAAALDDMDNRLDELHKEYIQAVLTWGREGDIQVAVQLALVGRYYERIGDHAVNIGERVRYMVTGWLPEHTGAARTQAPSPTWGSGTPTEDPGEP